MKTIPLTQGKVALVDDDDFERLSEFKWTAMQRKWDGRWYACRWTKPPRQHIYMHREIMRTHKGIETDHKNGDGLDNQRTNLRNATKSQNGFNSRRKPGASGVRGVHWYKRHQKWVARIKLHGQEHHLGYFNEIEDAIGAYHRAALDLYGEFINETTGERINGTG